VCRALSSAVNQSTQSLASSTLSRLLAHLEFVRSNPLLLALLEAHPTYSTVVENCYVRHQRYSSFLEQLTFDGHSVSIVQSVSDALGATWHADLPPADSIEGVTCTVLHSLLSSIHQKSPLSSEPLCSDLEALMTLPLSDRCETVLHVLERILESLRDHFLSFSTPLLSKQSIIDVLHPVCSDVEFPIDFRLGLLRILESSQLLVTSDKLKKLFYKVEAIALKVS
jgi:hypothetical protein